MIQASQVGSWKFYFTVMNEETDSLPGKLG